MFSILPTTIAGQFTLLFVVTFSLVTVFTVLQTRRFSHISQDGVNSIRDLQSTWDLNDRLNRLVGEEHDLVLRQFERVSPSLPKRLEEINYLVGEVRTEYLRMGIGVQERLTVERIGAIQSEVGLIASQIVDYLTVGRHDSAMQRLRYFHELESKLQTELKTLRDVQTRKVKGSLVHLRSAVSSGYTALYALCGGLVLVLAGFALMLRRRVLHPLNLILKITNEIRQGRFCARSSLRRPDEIGRLSQGVDYMAESLAGSYSELESKVAERTRQIEQIQQQLIHSEKMAAVGQLVSGVAHELNNPLTAILGFAELAKMDTAAGGGNTENLKLLEDIHRQADRCRRIIANLLQFARRQAPVTETVRINQVVDEAIRLREYELKAQNIRLVRDYDGANPLIQVDPHKIQQVVLNLLNNAIDAIREKGQADGACWIQTRACDGSLVIECKDNGIGIHSPERVFDPFYTTKGPGKGTGLGLSVCYGIIREHGGEIRAENWEQGARFVVVLPHNAAPLPREAEPAKPQEQVAQDLPMQKRRALIVDDELPVLRLQRSFLSRMGLESVSVNSGSEAIRYLENNPVDIVISDIRMPGAVNGIRLYEWIQANRPELARRFLFVSGDMVEINRSEFFADAAVSRIQKPFLFGEYQNAIRSLLVN